MEVRNRPNISFGIMNIRTPEGATRPIMEALARKVTQVAEMSGVRYHGATRLAENRFGYILASTPEHETTLTSEFLDADAWVQRKRTPNLEEEETVRKTMQNANDEYARTVQMAETTADLLERP